MNSELRDRAMMIVSQHVRDVLIGGDELGETLPVAHMMCLANAIAKALDLVRIEAENKHALQSWKRMQQEKPVKPDLSEFLEYTQHPKTTVQIWEWFRDRRASVEPISDEDLKRLAEQWTYKPKSPSIAYLNRIESFMRGYRECEKKSEGL